MAQHSTRTKARHRPALTAACLCLLLSFPAWAQTLLAQAQALFDRGDYARAAELAEQDATPQGKTLACWALLAGILDVPAAGRMAVLDRAEALSRQALAEQPDLVQAMLQINFVLGYRSRAGNVLTAFRKGWAREGKALFQRAIGLQPGNAWAHAVAGGWNAEVVLRGGGLLYGASATAARAAFERAMQLDPANPVFPVQYAIALTRLKRNNYDDQAAALLQQAAALAPRDALERQAQQQGAALAAALPQGRAAVEQALDRIVPFLADE